MGHRRTAKEPSPYTCRGSQRGNEPTRSPMTPARRPNNSSQPTVENRDINLSSPHPAPKPERTRSSIASYAVGDAGTNPLSQHPPRGGVHLLPRRDPHVPPPRTERTSSGTWIRSFCPPKNRTNLLEQGSARSAPPRSATSSFGAGIRNASRVFGAVRHGPYCLAPSLYRGTIRFLLYSIATMPAGMLQSFRVCC